MGSPHALKGGHSLNDKVNSIHHDVGKRRPKKTRLITSPILLAAAAYVGINKYRQAKKLNKYMEQARTNTKHIRRVLILGDSVAKGYGSPNGGITNYLREHLESKFGEVNVENEGIVHLTSEGLLQKLINEKLYDQQLQDSNLVFINIGGNDLLQHFHKDGARAVLKNFFKVRSNYIKNLQHIIEYIEAINPAITIVVNNLYNSLEKDYQFFGLTGVLINYWNSSMNKLAIIRVNTKELGRKKDLWADMVHPNQEGYKELSDLIIKQVSNVLEEV